MLFERRGFEKATCILCIIALVSGAEAAETPEQEVVVRGHRSSRVFGEDDVSSTVLEGEGLRRAGLRATEVLAETPGVQVQRTGTGADTSTVSIRGLSGSQVPVFLAGIRLNDDFVGVADLSRIPLWMMHRVSVHRTANPLQVPRSGLAGAVVLEPRLPRRSEIRAGGMAGSYSAGALWGGVALAHGNPGQAENHFSGATSISFRREGAENDFTYFDDAGTAFDSSDDQTRTRLNADFRSDDLWAISRLRFGDPVNPIRVTLLGNGYRRHKGISSLALLPALRAREMLERGLFGITLESPCGVTCEVSSTTSASTTELVTLDPEDELRLGSTRIDQDSSRISNQLGVQMSPADEVRLRASAVYEVSRIGKDLVGLESPEARGSETFLSLIASGTVEPTESVLLRGEIRGSCARASGQDQEGFGAEIPHEQWNRCAPEGRLGGRFELVDGLALRASGVRGLRVPSLGERFGISATTRGNPDLEVEQAWSAEAGATIETQLRRQTWITADFAGFHRAARDLVAYRRASQGYVRPYNVGRAHFLGAEGTAMISAQDHLRLTGGFSLLRARDLSGPEPQDIPFRAALTWQGGLEVYWERPSRVWSHLSLRGDANYRAGRVADPAGLIVIPAQWVANVAGRVEVKNRLNMRVRLSNIFNQALFDTVGFPLPGRAFFMSAEVEVD